MGFLRLKLQMLNWEVVVGGGGCLKYFAGYCGSGGGGGDGVGGGGVFCYINRLSMWRLS